MAKMQASCPVCKEIREIKVPRFSQADICCPVCGTVLVRRQRKTSTY